MGKASALRIEREAMDKFLKKKFPTLGVPKWGATLLQNYGLYQSALFSKLSRIRLWCECGGTRLEIAADFPEIAPQR